MASTTSVKLDLLERAELRRIARELAASALRDQRLSTRGLPADRNQDLRSCAAQFRAKVSPFQRVVVLRKAVQECSRVNFLLRHANGTWHAYLRDQHFYGSFDQIIDAVVPLVQHRLKL